MAHLISKIVAELNRIDPTHGISIIQEEAATALFLVEGGDEWVNIHSLSDALHCLRLITALESDADFDIADILAYA
jgi:hypothetical protein